MLMYTHLCVYACVLVYILNPVAIEQTKQHIEEAWNPGAFSIVCVYLSMKKIEE